MNLLSLDEIKLYRELENRETSNAKQYVGMLIPIAKDMDVFLSYIKNLFPEYPDHGMQHSLRILNYISEILTEKEISTMSDTEIFVLIMVALFHDTGMSLYDTDESNKIRQSHHEFSSVVIDKYFQEKLGLLGSADRFKTVIKFACRGHGLTSDELYRNKDFGKRDRIQNDVVRYSLLAVLIRIGDLMDLEDARVNPFVLSSFSHMFPKTSLEHNLRHLNVNLYDYSSEEISIEVFADNIEQYRIWRKWLDYLQEEILQANTSLQKYKFYFPFPKIDIKNNGNYEVEDIRFEIDETGGIWKIISQSIYTDEKDFIRELIQNAIDASLICIYKNKNIDLEHKSPRAWRADKHCKNIFVGYSEKENELWVIDSGIGMNNRDLKNFLFKVSGSGYINTDSREFSFPSIASFGIGFVSCLINAFHIEIYTKKETEEGYKVTLEEGLNLAFLQKFKAENFSGTVIKLKLKQRFLYKNIASYIEKLFVHPSVGITCVELDDLENVARVFGLEEEYGKVKMLCYNYTNFFEKIKQKKTPIMDKMSNNDNELKELESGVEELLDWIRSNLSYDEKKSDIQKFNEFKLQIQSFSKFNQLKGEIIDVQFPLSEERISEKTLFNNPEEYLSKLEKYIIKIRSARKECEIERKKYEIKSLNINCYDTFASKNRWKYLIVFLDENLEVSKVILKNDAIDLSEKSGIIFIRREFQDYDEGIEFSSINGFLFSNGRICNTIARFKETIQKTEVERKERNVLIGGMGHFYELYDDLNENYQMRIEDIEVNDYCGFNCSGTYELGAVYDDLYDVIYLHENGVNHSIGLSLSELQDIEYSQSLENVMKKIDIMDWFSEFIDFKRINWKNENESTAYDQLELLLRDNSSKYYQDGIEILCNIQDILPIGYFRIRCNCTSDARMILNVTRHKPSEIYQDVEKWCTNVGYKIQTKIIEGILESAKNFNLDIELKDMLRNDVKQNSFSNLSANQFTHIMHENF